MKTKNREKKRKAAGKTGPKKSAQRSLRVADVELSNATILKIRDVTLHRLEQNDSLVILSLQSQSIYKVTGIAAYLWLLLDGSRTLGEVLATCKADLCIKNPPFEDLAMAFFKDIFLNNLVEVTAKKKSLRPLAPNVKKIFRKSGAALALTSITLTSQEVFGGTSMGCLAHMACGS